MDEDTEFPFDTADGVDLEGGVDLDEDSPLITARGEEVPTVHEILAAAAGSAFTVAAEQSLGLVERTFSVSPRRHTRGCAWIRSAA